MKNILYALLCTSLLLSCKSNSKQSVGDTTSNNSLTDSTQKLIAQFKPFIQGVWVKSDYIDAVSKTKSPYKSSDKLGGVASVFIDFPVEKADSIHIGYSLNNHEGSEFTLYFKTGQMPTSLKIGLPDYDSKSNFYELGYAITNKDTSLILYHYNKANQIIDKTRYTRVAAKAIDGSDAAWGIQYITNKKIITGNYMMADSTGSVSKCAFTNEGNVSGFPDFKSYWVNTDFEAGPENNLDEIFFDLYSKQQKSYAYKILLDTLKLYDVIANADSTEDVVGKLRYTLVRKK